MFQWTVHLNHAPNRGCHHAAVAVENKLYSFGPEGRGHKDGQMDPQIGVFVFNTVSLLWKKLTPETPGRGQRHLEVPSSREGHTAVLIEDTIYLWGGDPWCDVLYAFDVDAHRWFKAQVSGTLPVERDYHSACDLGKVMFIHGGRTRTGIVNDIYKLDTTTMVWSLMNTRGTPAPASWCHSATIIGTKMFVFGGWEWGQFNTTIRVFDTETHNWMNTYSITQLLPEERGDHSAFTYNGELFIFGGAKWGFQDLNDLWKFSPETVSWKEVEPNGKQPGSGMREMCCCMVGDRIFFFGGRGNSTDLYVLDLSPSLKTLCKLAVIQYGLEQSGLPHNIRRELQAATDYQQQYKI